MTQAYDKDGNKIPFALYKGDYVERDFQTVEQLQATIASQAEQIEALRATIADHIEAHDWSAVDPIDRGYPDVDDLRAALQPKEGE